MSLSPSRVFAELNAARPPDQAAPTMGTAVVVGGSIAGLLAARVLSDHADSVVIIDRDDPQVAGARPGVPQGTQLHALLPGGLFQLERLFPGFRDEALARGAVEAPPEARRNYLDGRLKVVVPDDADSLAGSRPLLEGLIRQQVLRLPNVKTITARATGLVFEGAAVTGVRCEVGGVPGVERATSWWTPWGGPADSRTGWSRPTGTGRSPGG